MINTGYPQADAVLETLLNHITTEFPGRLAACYVHGSYADGVAIPTSDIDIVFALHDEPLDPTVTTQVHQSLEPYHQNSPIELDIDVSFIAQLRQNPNPQFMLGSRLIHGFDVRSEIPELDVAVWGRKRMHSVFWLINHVFKRPIPVRWPLAFPDADRPWYGYAERRMALADGSEIQTTRDLIRVTGWMATARVAYETGHFVVRKHEVAQTYARLINDEWSSLLEAIDRYCRQQWEYRIPTTPADQAIFDDLLHQTLQFENHFVRRYQCFMLNELREGTKQQQLEALGRLIQTPIIDDEISVAVAALQTVPDVELRTAANQLG